MEKAEQMQIVLNICCAAVSKAASDPLASLRDTFRPLAGAISKTN